MTVILVVEDELDTAELIRFALEREGYGVVLAGDGREALGRLEEAIPAAVLGVLAAVVFALLFQRLVLRALRNAAAIVRVIATREEAAGLRVGAKVMLVSKAFNPMVVRLN